MAHRAREAPTAVIERLALILEWYKGMIGANTGRLVYVYDPVKDVVIADGSPIRDIASIWDVELLSRFLERDDLLPLCERSLTHYTSRLVARDDALIFDPTQLGEAAGIAHSAFMILALLESDIPEHQTMIVALAQGLLDQQRADGSYRIYFGSEADEGLELYPGEAMLALMQTYVAVRDWRYLRSVERGFGYYRDRFPANAVATADAVFYANWQSQYAALLHANTRSDALRRAARDYVFALHDHVLDTRLYDDIERHPMWQATVQVACALEGLNDAYTVAMREKDASLARRYERCIRIALAWLFDAQRLEHCTSRERGGFGHSLTDRTQRIDVTGHVLSGFIKSERNHLGA
jgi:hypothetical protein